MLNNYLRIALRILLRQKVFSFINVFGLALGIACCILITLFIEHEISFDQFHKHKDRLFRTLVVEIEPDGKRIAMAYQPLPMGPALQAEYAEIEAAFRIFTGGGTATSKGQSFGEDFTFTDPAFFSSFDFPLLHGDAREALADPSSVVITRRIAEKYFGQSDPIGEVMHIRTFRTEVDLVVTGVAENPPDHSSIQFDFVMHISQYPNYERNLNRWSNFNGSTYVLLKDGTEAEALQAKMPGFVDKYWSSLRERMQERGRLAKSDDALQLQFQSMTSIHLDTSVNFSPEDTSNPLYTYVLSAIAFLVLTIACINFITLAIGRSATRTKEVGVRKVMGAKRMQLVKQFWGEALLFSGLAVLLGLVLAELFLPVFSTLAEKNLEIDIFSNFTTLLILVGLMILVGLLSGSYPATFLSRFQPVAVLKGGTVLRRKSRLTRLLIVFQFGLSIFLIICTFMMVQQQQFVASRDLGYNPENVMAISTFAGAGDEGEKRMLRLRGALADEANVLGVTGTSAAFNKGWDINTMTHQGSEYTPFVYRVDYDYLDMLGISLIQGRNFSRSRPSDIENAVIINQTFADELKWQQPLVGQRLQGWNEKAVPEGPEVIGVVADYHFLSLHQSLKPVLLVLDPDWSIGHILVRIKSEEMAATVQAIGEKWREVAPNAPFEYTFIDEDVRSQYASEMRWQQIITYSAVFAIVLACLGLFGLATLAAHSRTKEIGIRKVLGASATRMATLLSRDFTLLVLLANLIAWPVAWYATNQWLQNYAYRIDISIWVFALAGGFAWTIALVTVSSQAIKAALANPVDTLRYE